MKGQSAAEQLLKDLGVVEPKDIDLEAIAYSTGALVKYQNLSGCEARIVGRDNKAVITINKDVRPARRRFSIGHELGHWHHHRGRAFSCRASDIANRTRELTDPKRVADRYAADLLMPRYIFEPMADAAKKCSFKTVDSLREEFGTSTTATAIRLVQYGPEPAMLVCHTAKKRKWFRRPDFIPEHWFPREDIDHDSYAFNVLYGSETQSPRRMMPSEAWFDNWKVQDKGFHVFEETRQVTSGEILTLIVFKDEEMISD